MMRLTPQYHAGTSRLLLPYGFTTLLSQSALFCGWLLGSFGSVVTGTPVCWGDSSLFCAGTDPVGVKRFPKILISFAFIVYLLHNRQKHVLGLPLLFMIAKKQKGEPLLPNKI
jgi:hypothetical protein